MKRFFLFWAAYIMQHSFLFAQSEQRLRDALKRLLWAIKNASQTLLSLLESFKIGIINISRACKVRVLF